MCFREDAGRIAVSLTKPDADNFVLRLPSLTFMGFLGSSGVLMLQKTLPPLRREKRFMLMKVSCVNIKLYCNVS